MSESPSTSLRERFLRRFGSSSSDSHFPLTLRVDPRHEQFITQSQLNSPTLEPKMWKSRRSKSLTRQTSVDLSDLSLDRPKKCKKKMFSLPTSLSIDKNKQDRIREQSGRRKSTTLPTGSNFGAVISFDESMKCSNPSSAESGIHAQLPCRKSSSMSFISKQAGTPEEKFSTILDESPASPVKSAFVIQQAPPSPQQVPPPAQQVPPLTPKASPLTQQAPSLTKNIPPLTQPVPPLTQPALPLTQQAPLFTQYNPPLTQQALLPVLTKIEENGADILQSSVEFGESYTSADLEQEMRSCKPFPVVRSEYEIMTRSQTTEDSLMSESKKDNFSTLDGLQTHERLTDAFLFDANSSYDRALDETPRRDVTSPSLLYGASQHHHRTSRTSQVADTASGSDVFLPTDRSNDKTNTQYDRLSLSSTNTTNTDITDTSSSKKKSGLKGTLIRRARSITKLDKRKPSFNKHSMGAASSSKNNPMPEFNQSNSPTDHTAPDTPVLAERSNSIQPLTHTEEVGVFQHPVTPDTPTEPHPPITPAQTEEKGSLLGKLKRSMSLTRLAKRRTRRRLSTENQPQSAKLKGARSYESLLVTATRIPSVDLADPDTKVQALHSSILGEDNCIQIQTCNGSTFYSCRNSQERSQWLHHLKRTITPSAEQTRRTDISLTLHIQECKNCGQTKKQYYSEIALDGHILGRTSCKIKNQLLFWGEKFSFEGLQDGGSIKNLTITLIREADRKKKKEKNQIIGVVTIPVSELPNRKEYEKWYPIQLDNTQKQNKDSKQDPPQIRIKIKYQRVEILPLSSYSKLLRFIKDNYVQIVSHLEPVLSVRQKDDVSSSLTNILQREQIVRRFLTDIIMSHVTKHNDNSSLLLRGNSISTKAIESYMKLIGDSYLQDTLGDFIRLVLESDDSCEVDPSKLGNNSNPQLLKNRENLITYCEQVWGKIVNSYHHFPSELRDVFASFRRQCEYQHKSEIANNLISACIFLRFICPAIMSPSLFNLCQELPEEKHARNFTLVAKTLQSLANFTKFGVKESYMEFLNKFVDREWTQMQNFLIQISSTEGTYQLPSFEGHIDSGKHLALLHLQLADNLTSNTNKNTPTATTTENNKSSNFDSIHGVLQELTNELNNVAPPTSTNSAYNTSSPAPLSQPSSQPSPSQYRSEPLETPTRQLIVPPTTRERPESDEYVELTKDLMSLKYQQLPGSTDYTTEGHVTPGKNYSAPPEMRQTTLAVIPPKHDSSQYSTTGINNSEELSLRDDSTIKSTGSNSSNINRSGKIVRHRVWDRNLTSNQLVNGDYIDLISYMEGEESDAALQSQRQTDGQRSESQQAEISQEDMEIIVCDAKQQLNFNSLKKGATTYSKEPPVAFINPAFKYSSQSLHSMKYSNQSNPNIHRLDQSNPTIHRLDQSNPSIQRLDQSNPSIQRIQDQSGFSTVRRGSETQTNRAAEFTPLPNKFNSLNIRGNSHKNRPMAVVDAQHSTQHSMGSPQRETLINDDPELLRDEKRFGYAPYPPQASDSPRQEVERPLHSGQEVDHASHRPELLENWNGSQLSLNSQQTGINTVQKRIDETERAKQHYENQLSLLRSQLDEDQNRLSGTEGKLAFQAEQTNQVMEEWKTHLDQSEDRLRVQQQEKDEQIKTIIQRLLEVEEELRREQKDMKLAISRKEQIIEKQEKQIRELDVANSTLKNKLVKLQTPDTKTNQSNSTSPETSQSNNPNYKTTLYVNDYKSTCC